MSDCARQRRRGDGEQRLRRDIEVRDRRGGILACDVVCECMLCGRLAIEDCQSEFGFQMRPGLG
jgi:hypothetical protein